MIDSEFGICRVSMAPVRAEASDKSEITSYLLFGEGFEIQQEALPWIYVKTHHDSYEGWIDFKQGVCVSNEEYSSIVQNQKVLGLAPYQPVRKLSTSEVLYLVSGSAIPQSSTINFNIGDEQYTFVNEPSYAPQAGFETHVEDYCRFFLHAPYLWGGRSLFGIDCSGFSQLVYRMLGFKLLRNASQQAQQGRIINFLQEANPGDLAFFDNKEGIITHVGILLSSNEIIHASGRVKIDPIDHQGIYSLDLETYTHNLRIIKRLCDS